MQTISGGQCIGRYGGFLPEPLTYWPPTMLLGDIETPILMTEGIQNLSSIYADVTQDRSLEYSFPSISFDLYEDCERSPECLLNLSQVEACALNSGGIESDIVSPSDRIENDQINIKPPPVVDVECTGEEFKLKKLSSGRSNKRLIIDNRPDVMPGKYMCTACFDDNREDNVLKSFCIIQ